jgi:hypothetical protein
MKSFNWTSPVTPSMSPPTALPRRLTAVADATSIASRLSSTCRRPIVPEPALVSHLPATLEITVIRGQADLVCENPPILSLACSPITPLSEFSTFSHHHLPTSLLRCMDRPISSWHSEENVALNRSFYSSHFPQHGQHPTRRAIQRTHVTAALGNRYPFIRADTWICSTHAVIAQPFERVDTRRCGQSSQARPR